MKSYKVPRGRRKKKGKKKPKVHYSGGYRA